MNIYFGCSITGGRREEETYQQIVRILLDDGHQVPTAHLSLPDVLDLEQVEDPVDVYHRDIQWIMECQVMVTEVSTPSHGVGYEIGYALSLGKPVLCLHQSGIKVSKMITGNQDPLLQISKYHSDEDIHAIIREFLKGI